MYVDGHVCLSVHLNLSDQLKKVIYNFGSKILDFCFSVVNFLFSEKKKNIYIYILVLSND